MKFKVGDKVKVINNTNPVCSAKLNSVWKIHEASERSNNGLYFPKNGNGAYGDNLIKINNTMRELLE